jgi:hypothetical protein
MGGTHRRNEYRIYNACVDVPLAEKLFRVVRLSDPNSRAEETLLLLSKERFNDLENQWVARERASVGMVVAWSEQRNEFWDNWRTLPLPSVL